MTAESTTHVLVAGGGVAGIEALLALRDLAGDSVELMLLAPEDEFVYRPMGVGEPFSKGHRERVPLREVARDVGARLVRGALQSVDMAERVVVCRDGKRLTFDALVVATGAPTEPALEHGLTWVSEADPDLLGGLLHDIEDGYARRIAFVIPSEATWSLPAYELAMMAAREAYGMGRDDVEIVVVTPEDEPLGLFGSIASAAVREELDRAGIRVEAGAYAHAPSSRELILEPGARRVEVDRIVALPRIVGPAIDGLPRDHAGFVPVDGHGRVLGASRVWAAGDATTFPIKQGGLACQQADAVAESIAALAGAAVEPHPFRPVLRGMLLTGDEARWMRHDAAGGGGEGITATHTLWWPPTKIAGRYVAPYLAERADPALAAGEHPSGLPVELDLHRELDPSHAA